LITSKLFFHKLSSKMNNFKRDYYNVLDLKADCNSQDIKRSYRILALRWHPDKHNNQAEATSKFNEIHEAYSVLNDPKQRQIYDKHGHKGIDRFHENGDLSTQSCSYFTKGFQGTDKSAFEVLWDILREKEDNIFNETDFEHQIPSDFDFNFFDDAKTGSSFNDDEDNFLNNYQPTFTRSEFLAPPQEHSTLFANQTSDDIQIQANIFMGFNTVNLEKTQNNKFDQTQKQDFTINRKQSIIIIDDSDDYAQNNLLDSDFPEQTTNPFFAQQNDFQNVLDQFHRDLEENLTQFSGINSQSRKIAKQERVLKHSRLSKNANTELYDIKPVSRSISTLS